MEVTTVQYDIAFGEKLVQTAQMVTTEGIDSLDAQRTVLYLSLLSTEISLKAMLEHAGRPVPQIRNRSHQLAALLSDLDQCEVEVEIVSGCKEYVSASRLRACQLIYGAAQTTVGAVIDAERHGASTYPNQIRYGDVLHHFPAAVVTEMAFKVSAFARQYWNSLRIK